MVLVHGLITALKDESGKLVGYHSTAIDVTGQKIDQESGPPTNVKLNLLSNITVHDIQNQVIVLNGLVYKAKHSNSPVQIKEYLSRIQQVADKIQSHVAFARDYQNLGKAPPTWIRLDSGIQDLASKFDSKWVQFEVDLGSLEVFSDVMLNRAFYNLIDDTLKHGQKATKIKFTAKSRGEDLILVYEDNGVGVPMDRKKNIFEKAPSTQKMHGLVLVKEILGITGMMIVENGEPGKGARFEIVVPKGNFRYSGNDNPRLN
jgi:signal transduction histidine kinase